MVTPVENVIRHVRLCAEIERFTAPQKAVVTQLLNSDEPAMLDVLDELKALRSLDGSNAAATGARITRIEEYVNASRLLKSTMIKRLTHHHEQNVVTLPLKPYQAVKSPLQWAKRASSIPSKKVVKLFAEEK